MCRLEVADYTHLLTSGSFWGKTVNLPINEIGQKFKNNQNCCKNVSNLFISDYMNELYTYY